MIAAFRSFDAIRVLAAVLFVVVVPRAAAAEVISLAWDASSTPSVIGYQLSYGAASGQYAVTLDVGHQLSTQVDFPAGSYYVTVRAYNAAGMISGPSNEVVVVVGASLPPSVGSSAQFLGSDSTTQGNWRGVYGGAGAIIAGDVSSVPESASIWNQGDGFWTWDAAPGSTRALQRVGGGRVAATWHSDSAFSIDVALQPGEQYAIALYALDWDQRSRTQRVEAVDAATGVVLDSQTMRDFGGGQYAVWLVRGHVRFRLTNTGGRNAVVSGIFLDRLGSSSPSSTARFVTTDRTTAGNWHGAYGSEGYALVNHATALPRHITVAAQDAQSWTWQGASGRSEAPLTADGSSRIAATWYSGGTFAIDVAANDGREHMLSVYMVDWDVRARAQRIDVIDSATGAVLDSRQFSDFTGGLYAVWAIRGSVRLNVTNLGPLNAVVSGVFLDDAAFEQGGAVERVGSSAQFMRIDSSTQGNWRGIYGRAGAAVAGDISTIPESVPVWNTGGSYWLWDGSPGSSDAPQRVASSGRVAATWYSDTSYSIDVAVPSGQEYAVALYALDWGGRGRSQHIEALDAATGAVLDTRTISEYGSGVYVVWAVRGHVRFRLTNNGMRNAVASGLFLDPR